MIGALLGSLIVAGVEVLGSYHPGSAWKYFVLFIQSSWSVPAGLGRADFLRGVRDGDVGITAQGLP